MQPENQSGAPVPQVPPAPQPMPQPVQSAAPAASAPQPPQPTYTASPLPQAPPVVQSQSLQSVQQPPVTPPPQPVVQPQASTASAATQQSPAPQALGSVAVAEQVTADVSGGQEGEIDLSQPVTWQAKEYIHQDKGTIWFVVFGVVIVALMAVAWFLMHSWSFVLVLIAIAVVIVVFAKRPPRIMEYALSEEGLHIDNTLHRYADFKSFGVIRDGEEYSIMLVPRRRFYPGITVYFPEEAGEDIVDVLGSRMPMRDLHLDVIDKLVRKLRL